MKISLLAVFAGVASAAGSHGHKKLEMNQFKANSKAALNLLAKSGGGRKLEDEFDEAFVAMHSVVFQSCHNTTTWTDEGAMTMGLVKFTLCPSDYCTSGYCSSSYTGEYVVDLPTFLDAYLEAQLDAIEYKCETMREVCGCDGDEDDCLYYCYKDYDDDFDWSGNCFDEQNERARYAECDRLEIEEDEERGRKLDEEDEYYLGPVCSGDGSAVYLAVFGDEDCQQPLSDGKSVYYSLAGKYHDNFDTSLVGSECVSCLEPKDEEEQNDDDEQDDDEVIRMCEEIYEAASKCETNLAINNADESGCDYISSLSSSRRFLAAARSMAGSSKNAYAWGGMIVLSVGAAIFAVKKMH